MAGLKVAPSYAVALRIFGISVLLLTTGPCCHLTASASEPSVPPGLFSGKLPLRVVSLSPTPPPGSSVASLSGGNTIQVVFNRAVIALGSDYGAQSLPLSLQPFLLPPQLPYRQRWVSTSIFRIDPTYSWPSDLSFRLQWNPDFAAFDGSKLEDAVDFQLSTPPLTAHINSVESDLASNLTGGVWSQFSMGQSGVAELPPDARLIVCFTHRVELNLLQSSLAIKEIDGTPPLPVDTSLSVVPCSPSLAQSCTPWEADASLSTPHLAGHFCANISITAGDAKENFISPRRWQEGQVLAVGGKYRLFLPKGAKYHEQAGLLSNSIDFSVGGLHRVAIPLMQGVSFDGEYFSLMLPHGLQSPLAALSAAISLKDMGVSDGMGGAASKKKKKKEKMRDVSFEAKLVAPAVVHFKVNFLPRHALLLTISPSKSAPLLDAFGLLLLPSSTTFFVSDIAQMECLKGPYSIFYEASLPPSLSLPIFFSRYVGATASRHVQAWPVISSNLKSLQQPPAPAVAAARGRKHSKFAQEREVLAEGSRTAGTWSFLNVSRLAASSGLFSYALLSDDPNEYVSSPGFQAPYHVVGVTEVAAAAVGWTPGEVAVWLTRMDDGSTVEGAEVQIWSSLMLNLRNLMGKGSTNADGLAVIKLRRSSQEDPSLSYSAVISYPSRSTTASSSASKLLYLPLQLPMSDMAQTPTLTGALLSDRSIYKPGDTIFVKGYVREKKDNEVGLPSSPTTCQLHYSWPNSQEQTKTLRLSPSYVSFNESLSIPKSAGPGNIVLTLYCNSFFLYSLVPLLADPRPPVATLNVTAGAAVVKRGQVATFHVRTATYTGAPIGGAEVAVSWTSWEDMASPSSFGYGGSFMAADTSSSMPVAADGSEECAGRKGISRQCKEGNMKVTTDEKGEAVVELQVEDDVWDLTSLSVSLSASWVGPTREPLHAHGSLLLSRSSSSIQVDTSLDPAFMFPGLPFAAMAVVKDHVSRVPQTIPVKIHLLRIVTSGAEADSEERQDVSGREQLEEVASCDGQSGEFSDECRFELPGMGRFVLKACMEAEGEGPEGICYSLQLGRTEKEWQDCKLARFQHSRMIFWDKVSYGPRDTAVASLENPFASASALLQWGSQKGVQRRVVALKKGMNRLEVPLEGICQEGPRSCPFLVVLNAPQQQPGWLGTAADSVPRSKWGDINAPYSFAFDSFIEVTNGEEALQVEVVAPAKSSPGEPVTVQVAVKDGSHGQPVEAEVLLMLVDQAMLDLAPSPLLDISAALSPRIELSTIAQISQDYLVFPSHVSAEAETAAGRTREAFEPRGFCYQWPSVSQFCSNHVEEHSDDAPVIGEEAVNLSPGYWSPYPGMASPMFRSHSVRGFGAAMASSRAPQVATMFESSAGVSSKISAATDMSSIMLRDMPESTGPHREKESASAGGGILDHANFPRLRSHFNITPVFVTSITSAETGIASFSFNLPDNIGTFAVRAVALAKGPSVRSGRHEASLITSRDISLVPSLPRIARVGDVFSAGVTLTCPHATAGSPVRVTVEVAVEGGVELKDKGKVDVELSSTDPHEVLFSLHATRVGQANFTFAASSTLFPVDGLAVTVPVEGVQQAVAVVTSFALKGTSQQQQQGEEGEDQSEQKGEAAGRHEEGLQLPDAQEGSGQLNISAGVGRLAAVRAFSSPLLSFQDWEEPSSQRLLSSLLPAQIAHLYSHGTAGLHGWLQRVRDSLGIHSAPKDLIPSAELVAQASARRLSAYTRTELGLVWSRRFSLIAGNPRAAIDPYLNAYGLFVFSHISPSSPIYSRVRRLATFWRAALRKELLSRAIEVVCAKQRMAGGSAGGGRGGRGRRGVAGGSGGGKKMLGVEGRGLRAVPAADDDDDVDADAGADAGADALVDDVVEEEEAGGIPIQEVQQSIEVQSTEAQSIEGQSVEGSTGVGVEVASSADLQTDTSDVVSSSISAASSSSSVSAAGEMPLDPEPASFDYASSDSASSEPGSTGQGLYDPSASGVVGGQAAAGVDMVDPASSEQYPMAASDAMPAGVDSYPQPMPEHEWAGGSTAAAGVGGWGRGGGYDCPGHGAFSVGSGSYVPQMDLELLVAARLAIGADEEMGATDPAVAHLLSTAYLVEREKQLSLIGLASLHLLLLNADQMDGTAATAAEKHWLRLMRVTSRTAYVARGTGQKGSAGRLTNAMVLMVLVKLKSESPLVEKLANHVAGEQQASSPFSFYGMGDKEAALSALALSSYDMAQGNTDPSVRLTVTAGDAAPLLQADFGGKNAAPVVSRAVLFEELGSPPHSILFAAEGSGEVSLSAALSFIPAQVASFPIYRGLFIQRIISLVQPPSQNGEEQPASDISFVELGQTVTVTLQLTSADDVSGVVLLDLPPAGLEPLDPNVQSTAGDERFFISNDMFQPFFYHFWQPWPTRSTRPSAVQFDFSFLPAGTHTVSYQAMAATLGCFQLPPAKAFLRDQPEVMGLSPGGSFWVVGRGEKAPAGQKKASPLLPVSCPNDCSGTGVCNTALGVCVCDEGFLGDDCFQSVEKEEQQMPIEDATDEGDGGSATAGSADGTSTEGDDDDIDVAALEGDKGAKKINVEDPSGDDGEFTTVDVHDKDLEPDVNGGENIDTSYAAWSPLDMFKMLTVVVAVFILLGFLRRVSRPRAGYTPVQSTVV